jgi:hypothetical protein
MVCRSTVVRIAALCLLILTGVEMFACELAGGIVCELSGDSENSETPADDRCLCCCFHVVLAPPPDLEPSTAFTLYSPDYVASGPARAVASPELPPRR